MQVLVQDVQEKSQEGFDDELRELVKACEPYLNDFHKGSVRKLTEKNRSLFSSRDREDYEEACYHLRAGLITFLVRELENMNILERDKVKIVLEILKRFLTDKAPD